MTQLVLPLPDNLHLARELAAELDADLGEVNVRRFPDGETWVRVLTECEGRDVVLAASMDRPDDRLPALLFLSETLRELGAARVGLVAPYLAYMRQDQRFKPGEGVTSRYVGKLLSSYFDWLVTVDPHLHRHDSLDQLYSIPTRLAHSARGVGDWINTHVDSPLLVGPDEESEQWIEPVATHADIPHVILEKTRHGDRDVEVELADLSGYAGATPIVFDDIISTGHTMIETVRRLRDQGFEDPICVGVHGIFADDAEQSLLDAGAARIVTCNTIHHHTNAIDVYGDLAQTVSDFLKTLGD